MLPRSSASHTAVIGSIARVAVDLLPPRTKACFDSSAEYTAPSLRQPAATQASEIAQSADDCHSFPDRRTANDRFRTEQWRRRVMTA